MTRSQQKEVLLIRTLFQYHFFSFKRYSIPSSRAQVKLRGTHEKGISFQEIIRLLDSFSH